MSINAYNNATNLGAAYTAVVRRPRIGIAGLIANAVRAVVRAYQYRRTVAELSGLSDHMLDDIGVRRWEIHQLADQTARKGTRMY